MKKHQIQGLVVLAVLVMVYCAVAFLIPFERSAVFGVSFIFTFIALIAQVYVGRETFGGNQDTKSRFYGFPIVRVGIAYLIVQVILSILFMALAPVIPLWIPLLLYILLAGAAAVGFIATDITKDEVERQDIVLKANVSTMRSLQSKVLSLPKIAKNEVTRKAVTELAEALKYSDPVSSPAISAIEFELAVCVDELQRAVAGSDHALTLALTEKVGRLLDERNRQCKLNK